MRRSHKRWQIDFLTLGIYVIGFFYPVVPQGTARIRTQVSAAHSKEDLQFAIQKFAEVREEYRLHAVLPLVQ